MYVVVPAWHNHIHSFVWFTRKRQNAYKMRHIDEHMHAAPASVIGQYFLSRYSHFCFKSEHYYYSWRGGESHHVLRFPAIVLPGAIPLWAGGGKNGYARTRIVDFPPGKIGYIVKFPGRNSALWPFFRWEILIWKNHSHFSAGRGAGSGTTGGGRGGGKLLSDSNDRKAFSCDNVVYH